MSLSEADTRAKFIDPALHRRGWTEDLIRREETDCGIDIIEGKPRRRRRGRTDYLLRIRVNISTQPVPTALIEAKRDDEPPDKGLEQAKKYGRLNHVPFVYSSNGHLFVEYDQIMAEIGYGMAPKGRQERVEALQYKHADWFKDLPQETANTLIALAKQFERGETEELENPYVFNAPNVVEAGGIQALKILGDPKDIINETKERLFAA